MLIANYNPQQNGKQLAKSLKALLFQIGLEELIARLTLTITLRVGDQKGLSRVHYTHSDKERQLILIYIKSTINDKNKIRDKLMRQIKYFRVRELNLDSLMPNNLIGKAIRKFNIGIMNKADVLQLRQKGNNYSTVFLISVLISNYIIVLL